MPRCYIFDIDAKLTLALEQLVEQLDKAATEIERLRIALADAAPRQKAIAVLKLIDQRDKEYNLFDCPSGGAIRREIKQILEA